MRYWTFVYLTSGSVIASALLSFLKPSTIRWNRPIVFAVLLGFAISAFRWPIVFDNQQDNNPDESQILAEAIVVKSEPLFWKRVDGTTHGPVVVWPLALGGALGMRLDYTNARLLALGLAWATVVLSWLTLKDLFGDGLARILILPLAIFEITTTFWDFTQYSSEHVPMALIAGAMLLVTTEAVSATHGRPFRLSIAGALLGAVPFAKLQGAPIALWLGIACFTFLVFDPRTEWPIRATRCVWLISGALLPVAAIFGMIVSTGIFQDFWISYVQANLSYSNNTASEFSEVVRNFISLVHDAGDFREYCYPATIMLIGGAVGSCFIFPLKHVRFMVLCLGLLATSAFAVATPNRPFFHYVQFMLGPLSLAVGALTAPLIQRLMAVSIAPHGRRALLARVFVAGGCLLGASYPLLSHYRFREPDRVGRYSVTKGHLKHSAVSEMTRSLSMPNDTVGLWGWVPRYFVEANRRHATREAHTALELFSSPQQAYYRQRFLNDFRSQMPAVFLDSVGPSGFFFVDRKQYGHETFPELASIISAKYRLVADIDGTRIYRRSDGPFALRAEGPHETPGSPRAKIRVPLAPGSPR